MNLSQLIKIASDYKPLEYLLTLPVMKKIEMTGEDGTKFTTTGKRGLYNYQNKRNLTLQELIQLLPIQKYQFQIEFESEEREENILEETMMLYDIMKEHPRPNIEKQIKFLEIEIAKDPELSYKHSHFGLHDRFPLGEPVIATSDNWSYWYACDHGKFPLGEPVMAKNVNTCYLYARDALHDRFLLGEPVIAQSAEYACYYARDVIKGRFPLGESAIAQSATYACQYARNVIKERFPLGEPVIAQSAHLAYYYARDVIKGRFPLGEPAIAKDALYSYYYARDVLHDRFSLGEPAIAKNPPYSEDLSFLLDGKGITKDLSKEYSKIFFKTHEIDFKSKSLNKYNEFRDLYIHQLKIKFPEWIKIPLEFQEGYLLYRSNGGKNLNPTSKILEKWKIAKEKIDKLEGGIRDE
jgi:hypothetical protein